MPATRKKIPLIDSAANLNVTGTVTLAGSGSAVITFPSVTSTLATQADLALKAPLASPFFTGNPTAPTQAANDNSTKIATTAYADALQSATITLTNKRINPRLVTAASYTTNTGTSLDVSTCDQFEITAQAGALLFNAPGGTPVGGNKLVIRIKDNGTGRALTWNAVFRATGNALPSTTTISKTMYMGFIYNATDTKWDLVAVAQEA